MNDTLYRHRISHHYGMLHRAEHPNLPDGKSHHSLRFGPVTLRYKAQLQQVAFIS